MENKVLFTETQRFRQWWFWLVLVLINRINIWFLIKKYVYKETFTNSAYHNSSGLEFATLITLLVTILILIIKLETIIQTDQIEIRFFPFHLSFRKYPNNTIESAFVRTYNPITEYGGWGIRLGLFGKGKAFNVSGNQGIQLVFNGGRKLLIGTQKPDEASAVLQKAGYLKAEL